ncbi:MAG: response regulator [Anaerolineae bacterium]
MMKIPRAFEGWDVLVVDDEPDSLEVATRLLKIAGATVVTTGNGKSAQEIIRSYPRNFKFILSDLSMPDMDGWELLYILKQEPRTMSIPIIALTAHAMAGDRERGMAAGFYNYITKPLDPTKFIRQIIGLLIDFPEYAPLLKPLL